MASLVFTVTAPVANIPNQMLPPTLSGDENALVLQIATQPTTVIGATVTGYDYEVTTAADTDFSSPVETGSILPGALNDQITFYPLTDGDYIARNRQVNTAGTGPWSEASAASTVTPASLTISLTLGTLDVNEFSYTLSGNGQAYRVITNSATAPTAAQVIAGQDHTGVSAPLSFGPQAVLFGAVTSVNDDISSLADGDWWMHLVATNPVAQSTVETLAFTKETTPAVVASSTGMTVTRDVSIGPKTYDIYDATNDFEITFSSPGKVEIFATAKGGDGGGRAGGGGAAAEFYENLLDTLGGLSVLDQTYQGTVGTVSEATKGEDTTFAGLTVRGGPHGQTFSLGLRSDLDGPSGAGEGGASTNTGPGVATPGIGLGNDGGKKNFDNNRAGGGGGAGGTGGDAGIVAGRGGLGGLGLVTEITGTPLMMCAGGEGGNGQDLSASGIGGNGETDSAGATGGVDGTGSGGGGGASSTQFPPGAGGSGRVIIRVEV